MKEGYISDPFLWISFVYPEVSGFFIAMFTGIINHLGTIKAKSENKLSVACHKKVLDKLSIGASIAVDGICLTVVKIDKESFTIDFMPETARRTNIPYIKANELVNVELPATPKTFLAGHIVQGHVDGLAKLTYISEKGNSRTLKFSISPSLSKYIVVKGSIALNGISLTVIEAERDYFTVGIIPHTWEKTMLHNIIMGDMVNIEVDVLAKYLEKITKRI